MKNYYSVATTNYLKINGCYTLNCFVMSNLVVLAYMVRNQKEIYNMSNNYYNTDIVQ